MKSGPSVPILVYHQVSPSPPPGFGQYCVTRSAFEAQMSWLARAGYAPVDVATLVEHRRGGRALPDRAVVLTFDDGFRDCVDHAVPILERHAFTAVFYLVAGLMGRASSWLLRERSLELPLMDWESARRLEAAGLRCGAHSMTHPRLAEVSPKRCRAELVDSRHLIEDQLGHEVRDLAYPFGSYDPVVQEIAREVGYHSACSVRAGLSGPDDDSLALHRIRVTGRDSLVDFACRLHTGRSLSELARAKTGGLLRRLRRAPQAPLRSCEGPSGPPPPDPGT